MSPKKVKNIVVCPVYNEEETLKEFFLNLRRFYVQDILFIDDGSTDKSRKILSSLKDGNAYIIKNQQRSGYGVTINRGFNFALDNGYKKIVTIDADLQHNPAHIPHFFHSLVEADVVLGSRYLVSANCNDVPSVRLVINRYISKLISSVFCVDFSDPFCGYRGYRSDFLEKAFFDEASYGFALEVILEMVRTGTVFKEIPVEILYVNPGRKFLDGLDNPRRRLLYYLSVVAKKKKEIENEEIFGCKPAS